MAPPPRRRHWPTGARSACAGPARTGRPGALCAHRQKTLRSLPRSRPRSAARSRRPCGAREFARGTARASRPPATAAVPSSSCWRRHCRYLSIRSLLVHLLPLLRSSTATQPNFFSSLIVVTALVGFNRRVVVLGIRPTAAILEQGSRLGI